ncbi:FAD-dependent oxidoreductase [Mycobacterium sp. 852002-40037_SCH5390672]|nr:FAD-dependent oxidoreductase [Mycobacterium sp. 852002-40037_SCH5390672]
MSPVGEHAVVLGAGMAGLLTARVLSEFYDSVSVVERDTFLGHPAHRKGVPQGRHVHMFLGRGTQVLAELFPGVIDELGAAGAVVVTDGDLARFYVRVGRYELKRSGKFADPAAVTLCLASRPFVEFHVRRRVAGLSNVVVLDGHDVVEPLADGDVVTGVRIMRRDNGTVSDLPADLVVDAMGRAAHTPAFLDALGYGRPPETRSTATLGYSSQLLTMPKGCIDKQMVVFNLGGGGKPGGLLLACEHDTWMFAVGRTVEAGGAPADFAAMLGLAAAALPREIMDGLRQAHAVGEIATYRNPAAIWRRYDRMPSFPDGLLVIGDALCSPNPIYGQGMTMAAVQALALRDCLRGGVADLAQRFFHVAARDIGPTWARNEANDAGPSAGRKRSLRQRLRGQFVGALLNAAGCDTAVTELLLRVSHLIDPPTRLQDPALLLRILRANVRRRFARLHKSDQRERVREAS